MRAVVGVHNSSQGGSQQSKNVVFTMEDITNISIPITLTPMEGANTRTVNLSPGQNTTVFGPRYNVQVGREYRLTISLSGSDAVSRNDDHVYRFRVH